MTPLDSPQTAAREDARLSTGRFGAQEHSSPEAALAPSPERVGPSPKQLGMVGAGPASVNVFADSWDNDEMRPLRPYLPLTTADDDELFDARPGTRVSVVTKDATGRTFLRPFVRTENDGTWEERHPLRDTFQRELSTGEVWEEMFEEDGTMRSTLLHTPDGLLYSDKRYYVSRDDIDKPLTVQDAVDRLSGARRGQLVSRSLFGDQRNDGIPPALQGVLSLKIEDGHLSYSAVGGDRLAKHGFSLEQTQIFDREGDLVFRKEQDLGYGFEEVIRITDDADPLP